MIAGARSVREMAARLARRGARALSSLRTILLLARTPSLLRGHLRLRRMSKRAFGGWATSHTPRWWEYPWIIAAVPRDGAGQRAADFGAGKSPVPLALVELGYRTSVVDPDQLQGRYHNEWEFVDYGRWGIETIKAGMQDRVFEEAELDVAVSVSVIEHLPAQDRRMGLAEIARALKSGGLAILSVDVLPDGTHLWNIVVDEVEPIDQHGTVDDFLAECERAGLQLLRRARCPIELPHLRVEAFVLKKS